MSEAVHIVDGDPRGPIVELGSADCPACGIICTAVRRANGKCYALCDNCTAQREHEPECLWAMANRMWFTIDCEEHGYFPCAWCHRCDCKKGQLRLGLLKGRFLPHVRR